MRLESNNCYSLCKLHKQLNLSQSSLPTAIDHLPSRLNFTGVVIDYQELQLVGWKKEILITLSEGCIETIKLSMWLTHENPIGLKIQTRDDMIGQIVHVRHVHVTSFDFTAAHELQFYGEIRPNHPGLHTIYVLVSSGGASARFEYRKQPFLINSLTSLIPKQLQEKRISTYYPLLPDDEMVITRVSNIAKTFHYCLAKNITFPTAANPFQLFLTHFHLRDDHHYRRMLRNSKRWVLSYEQQRDWEVKNRARNQSIHS